MSLAMEFSPTYYPLAIDLVVLFLKHNNPDFTLSQQLKSFVFFALFSVDVHKKLGEERETDIMPFP